MELAAGSLVAQHHTQNGTDKGPHLENTQKIPDPRLYLVYFSKSAGLVGYTVKGCKGWVTTCNNPWIHFMHCQLKYRVVILEGINLPHPHFLYLGDTQTPLPHHCPMREGSGAEVA